MNNTQSSTTERLIERARGLADKEAPNDARGRFPSYLRVFDNFFPLRAPKLHSWTVQHFAACWIRFSVAILSVAFV